MRKPTLGATIATFFLVVLVSTLRPTASPISVSHTPAAINPTTLQTKGNETLPKYGGTMRIASLYHVPYNLNPLLRDSGYGIPIFSTLIRVDENGSIIPDLAINWDESIDGLNYTFYLYQNVTWHDGTPFNASDVEFTLYNILNNPCVDPHYQLYFSDVVAVKAVDEFTVIFQMRNPAPYFIYIIAEDAMPPIIPKHIYDGTDLTENSYNNHPVGTGPFRFVEWNSGINLTLQANPTYFRGRPYLDYVFYRWDIPLSELDDYLTNNEIDITGAMYEAIDPLIIHELEQIPGISTLTSDEYSYYSLGFNLRSQVLNDTRIRQATAHAINTSKICEVSYLGYAKQSTGPLSPSLSYWYNPNVTKYSYNSTRAEEMLDEAGYPRDSQTGFRFDITIKVGDYDPPRINATKLIAEDLRNVGINATVRILPKEQFRNEVLVAHDFNLTMSAVTIGTDPYVLYYLWHTGESGNYWNHSNQRIDYLLEQGMTVLDQGTRKQIYDEVQEILAVEVPNVFLYHRMRRTVYHNDFHGFVSEINIMPIAPYSLEKTWYDPTLSGQGKSPAEVCFVDREGRRTGFFNGSVVNEILGGSYDEERNVVKIRSPPETRITIRNPDNLYMRTTTIEPSYFVVEVNGTDTGHYHLELVNVALDYKHVVLIDGDTYAGKVDRYYIVVWQNGMIFQHYGPVYIQRTIGMGIQVIIPPDDVDPDSYETRHSNTIVVR